MALEMRTSHYGVLTLCSVPQMSNRFLSTLSAVLQPGEMMSSGEAETRMEEGSSRRTSDPQMTPTDTSEHRVTSSDTSERAIL